MKIIIQLWYEVIGDPQYNQGFKPIFLKSLAETFPPGSPERTLLLKRARALRYLLREGGKSIEAALKGLV